MIQLTADESRVLGVLVEKAQTTPEQYPLTLNAVVNGASQKSNRDPVLSMDEGAAFEALEGLRTKGLVVRVDSVGGRTNRYRHQNPVGWRGRPRPRRGGRFGRRVGAARPTGSRGSHAPRRAAPPGGRGRGVGPTRGGWRGKRSNGNAVP